jgi:molybdopterin-guanine dinucleotide biosynthesis protein A
MPDFDAIVLAGGRSSRLGGVPKALLKYDGATLLRRALDSVRRAAGVAVVGPPELAGEIGAPLSTLAGGNPDAARLPPTVLTREDPPFAGPAAGIGAGAAALRAPGRELPPYTLLLACDMPLLGDLPARLLDAAGRHPEAELWMPVDAAGKAQPLASCIATDALARCLAEAEAGDPAVGDPAAGGRGLAGMSVLKLLARVQVYECHFASGATGDVDTWADAEHFGIARP